MKKIAIITLTETAFLTGQQVRTTLQQVDSSMEIDLYGSKKIQQSDKKEFPSGRFTTSMPELFSAYEGLICIMATGIVVRSIAPLLKDKRQDPGVIVMDELGQFAISLLSGHIGGGNELARLLEKHIGCTAVITTATDVQNVTAIDSLAKQINGSYDQFKQVTVWINGLLANHRPVAIYQEGSWVKDTRGLTVINHLEEDLSQYEAVIIVSPYQIDSLVSHAVQVVPKCFVLGMGAKKDTSFSLILEEFTQFCNLHHIHQKSIQKIVSIDLKKNEAGIIKLATHLAVPFETYTKEELLPVSEKYPQSDFVKSIVGVGNVALSAADLASHGQVLTERYANRGVTFALGKD
ncbi:cobalt-precorrin 5A hydrolase [Vagococcus humatus]|uniref:Cobalamin biosynthesis protein CbiG n=1 Tax=Vagococcus humatus TaxID=1889241 RepID=A0A429Z9D2_9ENTE|nr:cobalt-precorrin 5A hydrolase [Vagococcus humatus]RST90319.1 hypothetical protein C7P63_04400 [Vagococcus humatus]